MYLDDDFNPYARPETEIPEVNEAPQMNTEPPKAPKQHKKKGGFKKVCAYTLSAILLGGIAGGACYGVSYAGYTLFPINNSTTTANVVTTDNSSTTATTANATQTVANKENTSTITATVMDVSDIVDEVITSVVQVTGTTTTTSSYGMFGNQTYKAKVSGSGIIIGTNDTELLIVTNNHVIDDVDDLQISLYDGNTIDAYVKGTKSEYDLAVIAVKLSDIPTGANYSIATLGDSDEVKVGDAAIAIGNAVGYGISVTTGCISALNKSVTVDSVTYNNLIQTDAAINPGNSGGALFNAEGEVIGINSVKMSTTSVEGIGYAISVSSVKEIIDELSTEETREKLADDERGYFGITGVSITSDINQQYGYPVGVLVRTVTEGSGADNAGIEKNDIIKSFDGQTLSSFDELYELMYYYAVGETVTVEYYHLNDDGEYELQTVDVTLTERPEN